ncbi:membrane protease YdiL (CAAX protease family) [Arthrobacter bambusae]|uniref:Membrane protease YdiL (CAAX protease family) n=2 Tax=Arthrobacter bambusae TaxID=1338426 RepID=A0ABV2P9B8_9MICC
MMNTRGMLLPTNSVNQVGATSPPPPGTSLKQALWALMWIAVYLAVVCLAVVAAGLSGLVHFTAETAVPVILGGATAAAMLATYIHLVRRNQLTPGMLGFRRLDARMLHLLWQIPTAIVASACAQGLFLAVLSLFGVDGAASNSSNGALGRVAALPAPLIFLTVLIVAVLTPLWEEVLFRGAFLSGLTQRCRPFAAVAISAAIFAAVHLDLLTFVYLFMLGIALALLKRFHQNLWAPVFLHSVNNALVLLIIVSAMQN